MGKLIQFAAHLIQDRHLTNSTAKRYVAFIHKHRNHLKSSFFIPYFQELLNKGYCAGTINSGMVNAIRSWGNFTHNSDLLLIKKLPVPKNQVSRSILSVEEIQQLLTMPCKYTTKPEWDKLNFIFEILARCAFRPIELLRLRVKDVNLGLNTFDLSGNITKTHRPRSIPIPRELLNRLKLHIKDLEVNDYLFSNKNGGMLNRNRLSSHFAKRIKRLGIKRNVSLYSLRHSAACRTLHNSDILTTKAFLGHQSLTTTETYIHLDTSDIAEAMDRDELVKGNMPIPEIFKTIVNFVRNIISGDTRLKMEVNETEDELIIKIKKTNSNKLEQ